MDDNTRKLLLAAAVIVIVGAILFLKNPFAEQQSVLPITGETQNTADMEQENESPFPAAPEIIGIDAWLNSEELKLADLRGKVVLVDFWTYSCVNCIRTIPHLKEWHEKYKGLGLVIIGVHSPEFSFEKEIENVKEATEKYGVSWPVALDNDMATWKNYKNRFWPAKYLIDAKGRIRYTHFGEGAYEETEKQIQALLEEAMQQDIDVEITEEEQKTGGAGFFRTRELYAGYGYGEYLGNEQEYVPEQTSDFADQAEHVDGKIYLQGEWVNSFEFVRHARKTENLEDFIAIKYLASEVNAVLGAGKSPYKVYIMLDGEKLSDKLSGSDVLFDEKGDGFIEVTESRLYNIIDGEIGIRELKLSSDSEEFSLYTFTFGG